MSNSTALAARNLTLTEELEKLEQSITLTLQEIDSNFSRAHRIVTTSILPIVEQYAKHSEAVWEGSKFWKQFFEASANVSLSGYEEAAVEDTTTVDETVTHTETSYAQQDDDTLTGSAVTPPRPLSRHDDDEEQTTSILSSPSLAHAHSTPRMPHSAQPTSRVYPSTDATFAEYPSPYESLKRELQGEGQIDNTITVAPTTPGKPSSHTLPDMSMTPTSSPFVQPPSTAQRIKNTDPILHRGVLDKTYRIAATPHTGNKKLQIGGAFVPKGTPGTASRPRIKAWDSSPLSSPELAAPQLRAELFSPLKTPRTPGISVQQQSRLFSKGKPKTPLALKLNEARQNMKKESLQDEEEDQSQHDYGETLNDIGISASTAQNHLWDSDSDGVDGLDFSPPKTMQFHVPQARLLQTPAREASRLIVQDLLLTAGGDITDDLDETSPSIVRRNPELDDTF